jgi:hypothetical protein
MTNTKKSNIFKNPAKYIGKVKLNQTEKLNRLPLGRGDEHLPIYVMSNPNAKATVILLPGRDADMSRVIDGEPTSNNFLSRSRDYFFNNNFNVILVFRASDLTSIDFDYNYRQTTHVSEIEKVINFANQQFKKPIWLIGTSRGTISAVATAIKLGNKKVKGLVLTSTLTSHNIGTTPIEFLAINTLKMPILMIHHIKDACLLTVPNDASTIFTKFTSSTIKKFIMITEGSDPAGDPCLPLHWHGYINYEEETVKIISEWIKNPTS